MITTIYERLTGDAMLMSILIGGLYKGEETNSISRQNTPAAYDEFAEIKPCALIKEESITPWGPHHDSARSYVTIWFYQRYGYASIKAARKRIYNLLHRQRVTASDGSGLWQIEHANDLTSLEAPGMEASMEMSRYMVYVERQ